MPVKTHHYSNKDITVVWKPDVCIHSTNCWKGLIAVFNPKQRPWIEMDAATTEEIMAQVDKCPSGALSYFKNEQPVVTTETDAATEIVVSPKGPYLIKTQCRIKHADGREEIRKGAVALCRCGGSGSKPFCDGTHGKIGFEG